jgi:hypothetical protein
MAFSGGKPDFDDFLASGYEGVSKTSEMRSVDTQYRAFEMKIA